MNRLIDKIGIFIICLMSIIMSDNFLYPVIISIVAIIISSSAQLLTGTKAAAIIIAAASCTCGVFPLVFCSIPLLLYDALWEKKWWLILPSLTVLTRISEFKVEQLMLTAAAITVTIIIYMRVSHLEDTVKMSEQNVMLAEAQDNEIHLATMRERNRIAREIHDNVGHMLTRSLLQSGALIVINKDEQLREPLQSLRNTLDSAMNSIRTSVHDLHDDSIDLEKVINDSISSVDSRFTVDLDCDVSANVPGNIKLCMIGVVKEGLSNAVKHSTGDHINIVIREHPAFYQLMIKDNGCCSEIKDSGIGLKNMRDRAEALKGMITFTPSRNGFRIFMSIPKSLPH